MKTLSGRLLLAGMACLTATALALPDEQGGKGKPKGAPPCKFPVTGKASAALVSFDNLMTKFVRQHDVPGAALAVGRHGKVVYARGFGYANREEKQPVQPQSLFRIASVSKPITAVAAMTILSAPAVLPRPLSSLPPAQPASTSFTRNPGMGCCIS